ncbi:Alpha/Beta hydrolase protein [Plectosphaerella plurivora]|uniref:Alpha/Beta hydrolase protein n=1 Tax=Plectosphaerella plurivora TaxID=936078 RepID=A0A9P9A860_9PEZI|nr:Alpha/Beta hydrolase protein [Plectosphaerella plurivora]
MRKSIKGLFKPSQKRSRNQSPSGSGDDLPDSEQQQQQPLFPGDEIGVGPQILTHEPPQHDGPDIVFVHGLRGSRLGTWTASDPDKTCWPRDLLAQDIPNARIIAWGYDSSIANVFKPASHESLFNHGETLVSDLAHLRGGDSKRPIIFVCHSLGGLVVKAGLIKANAYHLNQRHPSLGAVWETTAGVVFMGTPHRGSDKESYADIACKVAKLTFRRPNRQLLDVLRPDSQLLDNLRDDFTTVSKLMRIVCLWETLAMPIGLIVPESSACYEGFDVHILKALRYKSMNAWQDRIIEAQKYTCDWLVDLKEPPDSFWNWLNKPVEPIFWVSGKAGSGKSTLMRYIHEHSDVDENLKRWAGADQVTKAAFFFSEQAEKLLSSREGMLRSVLYQVLSSQTNLISHAYPEYFQRDLIFDADDFTTWTSLSLAFQALLKSAPNFHLFLLIDGLDEFRMYEEYDNYREEQRDLLYDGENEDEGWGINDWIIESHNQLAKFIIDCGAYTNIKIWCNSTHTLPSRNTAHGDSKKRRMRSQTVTPWCLQSRSKLTVSFFGYSL